MIKSPLRYPGGKSKALKFILPYVPEFSEYREPFLGGGSLFIYLKQKYPHKKFWINDIYKNLFLFWKILQESPEALLLKIKELKESYAEGKELFRYLTRHIEEFGDLDKAAAFFVFNRITFSGTTESGGFSESAFKKRFTYSSIERVKKLATILKNTKITNYDYQVLLGTPGENVFLFLDPPYYSATKSALYGKRGKLHTSFDHEKLAESLKKVSHKWLLTYDDSPYIRELYSFAYIRPWNLTYGMRNAGKNSMKGNELFIANYPLKIPVMRSLFDSV